MLTDSKAHSCVPVLQHPAEQCESHENVAETTFLSKSQEIEKRGGWGEKRKLLSPSLELFWSTPEFWLSTSPLSAPLRSAAQGHGGSSNLAALCCTELPALPKVLPKRSSPVWQQGKGRALIPPRHLFASHRLQIPGLILFGVEHLTRL